MCKRELRVMVKKSQSETSLNGAMRLAVDWLFLLSHDNLLPIHVTERDVFLDRSSIDIFKALAGALIIVHRKTFLPCLLLQGR